MVKLKLCQYTLLLLLCRLQALKEPAYSQKEAEMAAGMGNYILKAPDVSLTDVCMKETPSDTPSTELTIS